ncbi:IS91 family transposase, partial [Clostridium beijerinckii]
MMVTEGGKGKVTIWRNFKYFSYEALRKRWQKILLDAIIKREGNKDSFRRLKNKIYKNNKEGFYVHAKNEIKSAKIAAKYIGRYVGRPAIAESRILAYDGKRVTFKYKRHEDNKEVIEKVPVFEFIKKVIIHIPDKNFKMVRYFGLYSRRSKDKDQFIKMIDKKIVQIKKSIERWEYRILASFGVDPCKCPKCGSKMKFNDIVYPRYGSMREYFKKKFINEGKEKLE